VLHYAVCSKYAITVLQTGIGTAVIKIRPSQTRWHGTPLIMGAPKTYRILKFFVCVCFFFFGLAYAHLAEGSVLDPSYEMWEELRK
jgi:hypothetical protein